MRRGGIATRKAVTGGQSDMGATGAGACALAVVHAPDIARGLFGNKGAVLQLLWFGIIPVRQLQPSGLFPDQHLLGDRKSFVTGKSVPVCVGLSGRRPIK